VLTLVAKDSIGDVFSPRQLSMIHQTCFAKKVRLLMADLRSFSRKEMVYFDGTTEEHDPKRDSFAIGKEDIIRCAKGRFIGTNELSVMRNKLVDQEKIRIFTGAPGWYQVKIEW
jgi:hypothetical protein